MAFELHRPGHQQSFLAGSTILPNTAARLIGTDVLIAAPVATSTQRPFGYVIATAGASGLAQGEMVTVFEELNIVKAVAAASVGVGAGVTIASSNGALAPVATTGDWEHGITESPAAAGEVFSLYVKPRKV